ncbi:MAG: hypothetical protein KBE22_15385 [Candidatus Accumulibacter sp.]|nr:hypothetical protein [Accumulibacter sp.]
MTDDDYKPVPRIEIGDPSEVGQRMTIGQRLFFNDDTAQLGQLYYPSTATGWDDDSTEWLFSSAHIAMTTDFPYLENTPGSANILMSTPILAPSSSSGTMTTAELLPPTPIAVTGSSEIFQTGDAIRGIRWGWNGKVEKPLMGEVYASFTRDEYSGEITRDETFAGQLVTYTGKNSKIWDERSETLSLQVQYIPVAGHAETTGWQSLSATADTLFWENDTSPPPTRGVNGVGINGGSIGTSSPAVRSHEDQTGEFVVSIDAATLVNVTFSKSASSGEKWIATPNTTTFDNLLADPYGLVGVSSGMGVYSRIYLMGAYIPSVDKTPIYDYYKQNPTPPPNQLPGAQDDITAMFDAKAGQIVPQILYDCLNSDGYYDGGYAYSGSKSPDVSLSSESLEWTTVDHILFDETNGVYVSIEGDYSGADGDAGLTVSLRIITRYSNNVQVLEQYAYGSTGLPPATEVAVGLFMIPSPRIRAIFAPLYQEQGSFKGAHYVELSEEMKGALPAHLFNFVLRLMTYDSIGTVNGLNESEQEVYFIPCNLLEMLYSVVFSNSFGVSGVRYPVVFPLRFTEVMDSLFTNLYRVAVRDGVAVNWTDTLGADFAAVAPISLHRT